MPADYIKFTLLNLLEGVCQLSLRFRNTPGVVFSSKSSDTKTALVYLMVCCHLTFSDAYGSAIATAGKQLPVMFIPYLTCNAREWFARVPMEACFHFSSGEDEIR